MLKHCSELQMYIYQNFLSLPTKLYVYYLNRWTFDIVGELGVILLEIDWSKRVDRWRKIGVFTIYV